MLILAIVALLVIVALVFALRDTMSKLAISESKTRSLEKLNETYEERENQWSAYADSLETQLHMVQSFHRATQSVMLEKYQTIVEVAKKTSSNGNGHKDSKNTDSSQKPTTSADTSKATTLADLGTISAKEQGMIDKWHKSSTPDNECAKRIANIRASDAKRAVKA